MEGGTLSIWKEQTLYPPLMVYSPMYGVGLAKKSKVLRGDRLQYEWFYVVYENGKDRWLSKDTLTILGV